jgi:hypothetical protein
LFQDVLKRTEVDSETAQLKQETINIIQTTYTKGITNAQGVSKGIIFIQYQTEGQKAIADQARKLLIANSFTAPGIENVGPIPTLKQPQLRYFFKDDLNLANEVCALLRQMNIDATPVSLEDSANKVNIRRNQFELWFGSEVPKS